MCRQTKNHWVVCRGRKAPRAALPQRLTFTRSASVLRGLRSTQPGNGGMWAPAAVIGLPCTQKLAGRCGHRPLREDRRRDRRGGLYIRPCRRAGCTIADRAPTANGTIEPRRKPPASGRPSFCTSFQAASILRQPLHRPADKSRYRPEYNPRSGTAHPACWLKRIHSRSDAGS